VRERAVARTNIAILLFRKGDAKSKSEAIALLEQALDDARRLRLPEAEQIAAILVQAKSTS